MNSIVGVISNYQAVDNFYIRNSLKVESYKNTSNNLQGINGYSQNDEAATASISSKALELYNAEQNSNLNSNEQSLDNSNKELTQQEKQEVAKLKATDAEVKVHENAHKAAAGGLRTSAPNYEYETGPDGKKYAVAGDVNISYPNSSDPEENLKNAQQLKAAALAPAEPSSQDRKVAMKAEREIAKARQEIQEKRQKNEKEVDENTNTSNIQNQISEKNEVANEISEI